MGSRAPLPSLHRLFSHTALVMAPPPSLAIFDSLHAAYISIWRGRVNCWGKRWKVRVNIWRQQWGGGNARGGCMLVAHARDKMLLYETWGYWPRDGNGSDSDQILQISAHNYIYGCSQYPSVTIPAGRNLYPCPCPLGFERVSDIRLIWQTQSFFNNSIA
jgi:hypothetical protein